MTHAKDNSEKSSLILKKNTAEMVLGRTHDMLGLTARTMEVTSGQQIKAEGPERQRDSKGPYGPEYLDPFTGMEFVWVPGGSFEMGDVLSDYDLLESSCPVHTVKLYGFYMGRCAVTQGEWMRVMGKNPSGYPRGDRYPVVEVSWNDVQEFIFRLNQQSGRTYALPSEAQWEYAAREGGKCVRFGTGRDCIGPDEANYDCSGKYVETYSRAGLYRGETVPVDSFFPNALGLYQMSGNVWEWCQDEWHDNYEGAPQDGSVWKTGEDLDRATDRVIRGGGWNCLPQDLRAASRSGDYSSSWLDNLGFRLARPCSLQEG